MKCSRCQHENPGDAVFCQGCGTRLEAACQSCGTPNEHGAKFCKKCGHRLSGSQTSQAVPDPRFGSPESYTPKHLAEKILTSKATLEGTLMVASSSGEGPLAVKEGGLSVRVRHVATLRRSSE